MKDFNYNDYLRNNPLLKESMEREELSSAITDEIASQAQNFDDAVAQLEDYGLERRRAEEIAEKYHSMDEAINEEGTNEEEFDKELIIQSTIDELKRLKDRMTNFSEMFLDQGEEETSDLFWDLAEEIGNIIDNL